MQGGGSKGVADVGAGPGVGMLGPPPCHLADSSAATRLAAVPRPHRVQPGTQPSPPPTPPPPPALGQRCTPAQTAAPPPAPSHSSPPAASHAPPVHAPPPPPPHRECAKACSAVMRSTASSARRR